MHLSLIILIYFAFTLFTNSVFSQAQDTNCPLVRKTVAIEGGSISYLEGGRGEPILLLHGLFAQKEQWMDVGCAMASEGFDVLAPDLPGYGASRNYPISIYSLDSQVRMLHEFILHIGKRGIHIAGSSMGGTVAALYASKFPGEVKTLAFIGAPLGVIGWSPEVRNAIFQGINPFIPINQKQFDLEMHLLFFRPPVIDDAVKTKLVQEYVQNNRHYQQVWDIINLYDHSLDGIKIKSTRTLILWGEQDGIFSIDGLPYLKESFKNPQAVQFPDAAHLLMLEQPEKVVKIYGDFLKD